jgi:hypothetical protein
MKNIRTCGQFFEPLYIRELVGLKAMFVAVLHEGQALRNLEWKE